MGERALAVLVLADRDWTHPEAGGTGTTLRALATRWAQQGHRVTIIAGSYPGAIEYEQPDPGIEIHRMGTRLTVFPRAALAYWRGVGRDADVVLEVINGIAFMTPLWGMRAPRLVFLQHVHQEHYVTELGWRGRIAALLLERLPLRLLYSRCSFVTISQAVREDLIALGIPGASIDVVYLGVEPATSRAPRASEPTLLYLGRLKRYKRLELLLDVLAHAPDAVLEVAGDGDHREAFEAAVRQRGLAERVTMHGFVPDDAKPDLYNRAWLHVTTSSAEGWGLTVMEAAICGTATAALRVGGLCEAVVDGETGVLAGDAAELGEHVSELLGSPERRAALGSAAAERARRFSWDAAASRCAELLSAAVQTRRRQPEALPIARLAAATFANCALQLGFTVLLARLLGISGYGELAALMSVFLVMLAAGQALQLQAARQVMLGRVWGSGELGACLRRWTGALAALTLAAAAGGLLLRVPIAGAIGVPHAAWAAAAIPPTCALWLLLSLQRGFLQGLRADPTVRRSLIAEPAVRLAVSAALVLAGAGVTGAYLGTPIAIGLTVVALGLLLERRLGPRSSRAGAPSAGPTLPLRALLTGAWTPIAGLTLLALLQNVDLIAYRHQASGAHAGAYAAAAVAAKAILWVAVGIGIYLSAEATWRVDPRPVLTRSLALLAVVAVPALAVFALAPHLLLDAVFGRAATAASGAVLLLGAAMTLLAAAYLAVQYMLALGELRFLWLLGVVAVAEPLLLNVGSFGTLAYASVLFGLDCIVASILVALGLQARAAPDREVIAGTPGR